MANASLAQTAYDALLARLLDGRLPPGALIDRKVLAGELGMSVSPVVEALSRLAGRGGWSRSCPVGRRGCGR